MSAIYILWLRELKRYTRSRAQIVASLGQPMLYLLVLGFGLGPVFKRAGNGDYFQFIAPGHIHFGVLMHNLAVPVDDVRQVQEAILRLLNRAGNHPDVILAGGGTRLFQRIQDGLLIELDHEREIVACQVGFGKQHHLTSRLRRGLDVVQRALEVELQ